MQRNKLKIDLPLFRPLNKVGGGPDSLQTPCTEFVSKELRTPEVDIFSPSGNPEPLPRKVKYTAFDVRNQPTHETCWYKRNLAADVKMEIPVPVRSLKSSILSSTSFQMGKTFGGVASAAVEQSRCKANMVAQGDGKFGP